MDIQEEYLTIDDVAKRLKVAKATVYRMARKGKLPAVKFGKVWRISSLRLSELFEIKSK
jgi:excisionase family DNA binding protein